MRSRDELERKSPYVYNLSTGLLNNFNVVNYGRKMKLGVLDIFFYIKKADYLYFNWIENLSYTKVPFFLVIYWITRITGKRMIWTHHNKHPHKSNNRISKWLMQLMIRKSDYIVVHTKESYPLLEKYNVKNKIFYFFHPFFSSVYTRQAAGKKKLYDLLIWGNIRASKGVDEFLAFLQEHNLINSYRIKIVGKFSDIALFEEFKRLYRAANLDIDNRFLSNKELDELHHEAEMIFFPYTGSSVLNSGALITSLPKGVPVIGPNSGAFKELGELGYIYTYNTFADVVNILNEKRGQDDREVEKIKQFMEEHTWQKLSEKLNRFIQSKRYSNDRK